MQSFWNRSCRNWGITPTAEQWSLVVEGAFRRAGDELEATTLNHAGELITLDQKIQFWRENIPEAAGQPNLPGGNLLEAQRRLQMDQEWTGGMPRDAGMPRALLLGDVLDWRQRDLGEYMEQDPVGSPTADPRDPWL